MRCYPNYPIISKCVHSNWDKRIVELNPEELRLAKYALLEFRNELVAQGKPTEDVNELLLKIMK